MTLPDSALMGGYNGGLLNKRLSSNDKFEFYLRPASRSSRSWKEEALNLVDLIREESQRLGKRTVLFFSGGKDSEAVLRLFLERDFKPHIVMIRHSQDSNLIEFSEGIVSLEALQVSYEICDFDPYAYIESEKFKSIAAKEGITWPAYYFLAEVMERFKDDFLVLGHEGFQLVKSGYFGRKDENAYPKTSWNFCVPEKGQFLNSFCARHKISAVVNFFSYTPELLLAYLSDDIIQRMVRDEFPNVWQSGFKGCLLFYQKWFPEMRQRKKVDVTGKSCKSFDLIVRAFSVLNSQEVNLTQTVTLQLPIEKVVDYLKGGAPLFDSSVVTQRDWHFPDPHNFDTSKWKLVQDTW